MVNKSNSHHCVQQATLLCGPLVCIFQSAVHTTGPIIVNECYAGVTEGKSSNAKEREDGKDSGEAVNYSCLTC